MATDNCLVEYQSDCVKFSVDLKTKLSKLGYTSTNLSDLLLEFITKTGGNTISTELADLRKVVEGISADTLPANAKMFGLRTGSTDMVKVENKSVEYSLDGQELTYNFKHLVENLPEGIVYLQARADVVDSGGKRVSISGKNNTVTVPSLPATATLSLDVKSANGNMTLERSIYLESDVDKSAVLHVRDFTAAPADLKVSEAISQLSAEVALLKQRG